MTELSGFWTTDDATPEGDQQASYNQAYWTYAFVVLAACNAKEGVAPNYLSELAGTASTNNVAIASGGGLVDGKWFRSDASQDVAIPSSSSGKTRIDRIVLRADWAGFNVSVYRIAGTEGDTPSAPDITQTSGTTYDIMLYQATVNSSGTVTLTDERVWAVAHTDGTTLTTSAGNLKIKDDGVDSDQIAAGAIDLAHMSVNSVDSDQYVDGSIDNEHIRDSAGLSVLGRAAASTGDIGDISAGTDGHVLRRNGATLGFGTVDSDGIAAGAIDQTHMANNSVGENQILDGNVTEGKIGTQAVTHNKIGIAAVENDNIRDSAALSVLGRSANSTGDIADIAAGSDGQVLRRSGTSLGFGTVDSDGIAAGAIDLAHMSINSVDSDQYVDGSIDEVHLSSASVTHEKLGNGAPGLAVHQGGNATNWHIAGTTDTDTGQVDFVVGTVLSSAVADVTVTFKAAFSGVPLVFIQPVNPTEPCYVTFASRAAGSFSFSIYNSADARIAFDCYWMAIGPE
jgi:hypothetical protein